MVRLGRLRRAGVMVPGHESSWAIDGHVRRRLAGSDSTARLKAVDRAAYQNDGATHQNCICVIQMCDASSPDSVQVEVKRGRTRTTANHRIVDKANDTAQKGALR